jgi:hypothetical protein
MFRLAVLLLCSNLSSVAVPFLLTQLEPPRPDARSYPVSLDDHVIAYLRSGFKSSTAEERANAISERLERYASDDADFRPELIAVEDTEISTDIVSRDKVVMSVLDVDAASEGRTRQEVAEEFAVIIRNAVEQYRRDLSYENIVRGAMLALLATIVLIAILVLIPKIPSRRSRSSPVVGKCEDGIIERDQLSTGLS